MIVSKGEFAKICGVDKTAVSHWIKTGKISGNAFVGQGRFARIDVEAAKQQLKTRLDPGQRLGNGLHTKLDTPKPPASPASARSAKGDAFPLTVWQLIHDVPSLAAWHLANRGASIATAYIAFFDMAGDLREAAERIFGVPLPSDFEVPDWNSIAEEYGLSFDLALCQAEQARLDAI